MLGSRRLSSGPGRDRDETLAVLNTAPPLLRQLIDDKIDHYHMEKRYLRKDGQAVWMALGATKKTDSAGKLE